MLAALTAVAVLSGCGDEQEPAVVERDASPPTLLINEDADGAFLARVHGTTAVNDQGCITIDDRLLIAPEGSHLGNDGKTVELEGYAPFVIGDEVELGGGHEEVEPSKLTDQQRDCAPDGADLVHVTGVAPAR
ncbi:hypothetical protein [Aeromicrobium sp. CTD01-1L150]|uniref:hypothetical protein n=1 Tax=Aeromicrobium sp. CTD01-1L150 TaxID=3341830 RepID=UPI0035C22774